MDFNFTEEQVLLQNTVKNFVKDKVTHEVVDHYDTSEEFPSKLMDEMTDLGFLALPFPEQYGGIGGITLDIVLLLENISYGMVSLGAAYMMSVVFGGMSILHYGNEEQKREYIPKIISGEIKTAFALTEPNAGSDAASLKTSAVLDGNDYIINGNKVFITGAHQADYLLVAAKTDKSVSKYEGITIFLVKTNTPGIDIRKLEKLGMRPVRTNEVFFEDVKVPKENILGGLNLGWPNLLKSLGNERVTCGAVCTGGAQAAVDYAAKYAKERVQFGKPISKFQVIQHFIADMQMDVDLARLLTWRASWLLSEKMSCGKETAMVKVFASEAYSRVANKGVQILGGNGYMMEYPLQRHLRDSKFFEIAGGTSEIQRNIIAAELGL